MSESPIFIQSYLGFAVLSNGSKIVNAASSQMPTMTNNIVNAGDHGVGSTSMLQTK